MHFFSVTYTFSMYTCTTVFALYVKPVLVFDFPMSTPISFNTEKRYTYIIRRNVFYNSFIFICLFCVRFKLPIRDTILLPVNVSVVLYCFVNKRIVDTYHIHTIRVVLLQYHTIIKAL